MATLVLTVAPVPMIDQRPIIDHHDAHRADFLAWLEARRAEGYEADESDYAAFLFSRPLDPA